MVLEIMRFATKKIPAHLLQHTLPTSYAVHAKDIELAAIVHED